jgi:hypothetical protein
MQDTDASHVASVDPAPVRPTTERRRSSPWWLPVAVLTAVVATWFAHAGAGTVLALVITAVLLPVGRYAAERAVAAALLGTALVGVVFVLLPVPVTRTSATVLVVALPTITAAASVLRHRDRSLRRRLPRVALPDVAVLAVSTAAAWWVLVASYGMDLRDTLTRMYHGWDWVLHMIMTTDVYRYGRLAGLEIEGSPAFLSSNPQLHPALWAAGTWAGQSGDGSMSGEALLQAGILATALTFALCLGALAWVAADLTTAVVGRTGRQVPATIAVVATGAMLVLGAGSAVFFFGHTPFLLGVTALVVGSYQSVHPGRDGRAPRPIRSIVVLAAAAVVIVLEWPPLVLGLAVPGLLVAVRTVRGHRRETIALGVLLGVLAVTTPWWYARLTGSVTIDGLSAAAGEVARFSLPLTAAVTLVTLAAAAVLGTHGDHGRAAGILGPVLGMLGFSALLLAHGSQWWGDTPSYYLLKTLLGCLIAATPVAIAVTIGGAARLREATARTPVAEARLWAGVAAGTVLVLAVGAVLSPPDSLRTGSPDPLTDPPRFVTYADAIARAYPVTPALPSQVPFLADFGDERADLWLMVLQRGISDADHDFARTLPAFYPPQTSAEAESLVPPPADWGAVICAQLRVRPTASFVAMTEHPDEVREWARGVESTCDASRLSVLEIPGG